MERLMEFAVSVPDFRRTGKGNFRHKLSDILVLIILGRASNCCDRPGIIAFGKHNLRKFRSMGMLRNGVPSEPTLFRVEQGLDEHCLAERMSEFMDSFRKELSGRADETDIICIDGKAMRGTTQENGRNPDIVSAYSSNAGITLATEACREKSNEITAVPVLLDKIDVCGSIITADAMCMQKDIVDKIRQKNGDFVIELKANQRSLRYGIEDRLKWHTPVQVFREGPESPRVRKRANAGCMCQASVLTRQPHSWARSYEDIGALKACTGHSTATSSRTGLNARQRERRAISTHFKESCTHSFPSGEANARNVRTRPRVLLN